MRARTVLVAALLAGISIACSKPASDSSRRPDSRDQDPYREIKLVNAPSPEAPIVSALEAGLDSGVALGGSIPASRGASGLTRRAVRPKAETSMPSLASTEMAAPAPAIAATNTRLPAVPVGSFVPAATAPSNEVRESYGGYTAPSQGARGPVILIRGGMGTADDDCKIHPGPARGHGIAINNVAQIPGRFPVDSRRPSGGPGFTRIR